MEGIFSKRTLYAVNKELKVIITTSPPYTNVNKFLTILNRKQVREDYSNEEIYLGNQLDGFRQVVLEKNGKISAQSIFKDID